MKNILFIGSWLIAACLTFPAMYGQESQLLRLTVHSPALEGNLLGDSPDRKIVVYLPPSYEANNDRRYPVIYVIHGNNSGGRRRDLNNFYGAPMQEIMDPFIAEGVIKEMIVVLPDSTNLYGGSQYANSTVSGNWADFIIHDVITYMDENYRTLAKPESRGLTGHSMGGRVTLCLSLKYPGIFGVVYATSPGQMAFHKTGMGNEASWRKLLTSKNARPSDNGLRRLLGFSVAFAPNPDLPPYYTDFPMALEGDELRAVDEVKQRWAAFDPVQMAEKNADPYRELIALQFDCGTSDRIIDSARLFSEILTKQNVPHVFEEYDGGHGDKKAERFRTKVLPMFSKYLAYE
ncbi:MAG: alpha/beta fold hydrolase [Verrucomicrobia bacterium]|nr:alpha/beta fold hydrolase [Verrucomicrobiota bacterium]